MTNTTATATPKVPFTSTPQFRAVWIISESIRKNLEMTLIEEQKQKKPLTVWQGA